MKKLLTVLLLVLATDAVCLGQNWWQLNDTILVAGGNSNQMSVGAVQATVQSVNITGNIAALVIPVGFSDKSGTVQYPTLDTSRYYPVLGVNQSGTLLSDLIVANGGPLPEDQWWGACLQSLLQYGIRWIVRC